MVGLLVVLFVPLVLSFLAMSGLCTCLTFDSVDVYMGCSASAAARLLVLHGVVAVPPGSAQDTTLVWLPIAG